MPAPHPQLREKLVAASLALVEERGLALFSLRKVAGRVGVSPSAVYRHFRDKEDLLTAIVEDGIGHIVALQGRYLSEAGTDPVRQLEAMGLAQVRFAWRYPTHFRLLHMPEYSRPDRSEIIARESAASEARIASLLPALSALGIEDTASFQRSAYALTYGLCRMHVEGYFPTPHTADELESLARSSYALLLRGALP